MAFPARRLVPMASGQRPRACHLGLGAKPRLCRFVFALAGKFLLLAAGAAMADVRAGAQLAQLGPGGARGVVNSVAYGEMTPGLSIAVRPFDDSELNLALKERFEEELRRISRPVSDSAVLALSFETRVIQGRFSIDERNMGRFEGDSDVGVRFQLNLWSSSKDSLIGGRKKDGPREANVFHVNAVLRVTRTGATLWQGDAFCEMVTPDTLRIGRSMVRPLVANLGQTVKGEPFDID